MRTMLTAMIGMLLLVGACGSDEGGGPGPTDGSTPASTHITSPPSDTSPPDTSPPDTSPPDTSPSSAVVTAVYIDVEYYGACGNETVDVDGTRYYPMYFDDVQALDTTRYPVVAPVGLRGAEAARVAPPGPGDDIGTLIAYDDGIARFESESGWIIWLTTSPLTYRWEC